MFWILKPKSDSENYRAGIHVGFDDNARPYSVKETFKGKKNKKQTWLSKINAIHRRKKAHYVLLKSQETGDYSIILCTALMILSVRLIDT